MSTSDIQAVQEANASFYRAFEKKDLEAMATVWSQGISSLCIHPGRAAIKGWNDIRTSWATIFKHTQYIEIELDIVSTEIQGDLAYVVGTERLMQVSRGRRLEAKSMATNIFERMGDRWYLVHHHGSPLAG